MVSVDSNPALGEPDKFDRRRPNSCQTSSEDPIIVFKRSQQQASNATVCPYLPGTSSWRLAWAVFVHVNLDLGLASHRPVIYRPSFQHIIDAHSTLTMRTQLPFWLNF